MACVYPNHPALQYLGRWQVPDKSQSANGKSAGPLASWASATVRFTFVGRSLQFVPGPRTRRIDADNGGTKMLVCSLRDISFEGGANSPALLGARARLLATDARPGQPVDLWLSPDGDVSSQQRPKMEVELMLADWASELEIGAFLLGPGDEILPWSRPLAAPQLLFIGDSITTGYCDQTSPGLFERGIYDAYPFALRRLLEAKSINVDVDVVALPAIYLVNRDPEAQGVLAGMENKFWHVSPRMSDEPYACDQNPAVVFIALGANDIDDIPAELFISRLRVFLERLRNTFSPSLQHVVVMSPWCILSPTAPVIPYEPALSNAVLETSNEWASEMSTSMPYPRLHHVHTEGWYDATFVIDELHPSVRGHAEIARRLDAWIEDAGLMHPAGEKRKIAARS